MQNKGAVRLFAIALAIVCVYQLSLLLSAARWKMMPGNMPRGTTTERGIYLDSIGSEVVYNILLRKYTYRECKEREINLGLDLKGGMNVTLEVSMVDMIRSFQITIPIQPSTGPLPWPGNTRKTLRMISLPFSEGLSKKSIRMRGWQLFLQPVNSGVRLILILPMLKCSGLFVPRPKGQWITLLTFCGTGLTVLESSSQISRDWKPRAGYWFNCPVSRNQRGYGSFCRVQPALNSGRPMRIQRSFRICRKPTTRLGEILNAEKGPSGIIPGSR